MQEKKHDKVDNALPKKGSVFFSLSEQERGELLQRNRKAREQERKEFIETYFASDVSYNIK